MKNAVILSEAYAARISAVETALQVADDAAASAEKLRQAANDLDAAAVLYGEATVGTAYSALADAFRVAAMLVDWRSAVLEAKPEADRFLRAAAQRHKTWLNDYGSVQVLQPLDAALATVPTLASVTEVAHFCKAIASAPLPIGVFAPERRRLRLPAAEAKDEDEKPAPVELAVAFLRFLIDGVAAAETHFITPREAHDLEIEVRVSRWPDDAYSLELRPITIEAASSYHFPTFSFEKPTGEPPYTLRQRGRAILNVAQSLNARPFEFIYSAHFRPSEVEQPVSPVVGQRTLRIEGFDLAKAPITGYRAVDQRLVEIRDQLRGQPAMTQDDLSALLVVLTALAGLAARAIQDSLFKGTWSEAQFQTYVRDDLRRQPHIAAELEEHPHAGGGVTDLSFRGIRIELKAVPNAVTMPDREGYADQTTSYVVATGKRAGILCVLDMSVKEGPPFPAEEGLHVLIRRPKEKTICIVALVVQGNLARPSALSR